MVERWKDYLSRSEVIRRKTSVSLWNFVFSTVILNEGNKYKLKLKRVELKDAGDISFQCGDVKDSCKLSVREGKR